MIELSELLCLHCDKQWVNWINRKHVIVYTRPPAAWTLEIIRDVQYCYATFFSMDMSFRVSGLCMFAIGTGLKPFILFWSQRVNNSYFRRPRVFSFSSIFLLCRPAWPMTRMWLALHQTITWSGFPLAKKQKTQTHTFSFLLSKATCLRLPSSQAVGKVSPECTQITELWA